MSTKTKRQHLADLASKIDKLIEFYGEVAPVEVLGELKNVQAHILDDVAVIPKHTNSRAASGRRDDGKGD